jgi:hypothetical protein
VALLAPVLASTDQAGGLPARVALLALVLVVIG